MSNRLFYSPQVPLVNDFDLLVIGAGPAGYVGALRAAQLGARVCLVERADVGGVCLNRGCIPTKSLTTFVDLLEKTRAGRRFGLRVDGTVSMDLPSAIQRKNEIVTTLVKSVRTLLVKRGVNLVAGEAAFYDERAIEISFPEHGSSPQRLVGKNVLIATGSEPAELPGLSLDGTSIISSSEALDLLDVPGRTLIVGAGAIGCEFAHILNALGSTVIIVEVLARALPFGDEDVSRVVERELKKRKIELITSESVVSAVREGSSIRCSLTGGKTINVDAVLVSVGRRFATAGLNLAKTGVSCGEKSEILVNEYMETSCPHVYAAGDVVGKKMLAHSAWREATVAVENTLGAKRAMDYSAVPACVFTKPQIGSVGMTEKEARDKGFNVRTGVFQFRSLGMAHVIDELSGMVKIVADGDTDRVLGVHIVGPHAAELIHEGTVAVANHLTSEALARSIHAHPTLSEAVMEAAEGVRGRSIHSLQ